MFLCDVCIQLYKLGSTILNQKQQVKNMAKPKNIKHGFVQRVVISMSTTIVHHVSIETASWLAVWRIMCHPTNATMIPNWSDMTIVDPLVGGFKYIYMLFSINTTVILEYDRTYGTFRQKKKHAKSQMVENPWKSMSIPYFVDISTGIGWFVVECLRRALLLQQPQRCQRWWKTRVILWPRDGTLGWFWTVFFGGVPHDFGNSHVKSYQSNISLTVWDRMMSHVSLCIIICMITHVRSEHRALSMMNTVTYIVKSCQHMINITMPY